ncbi:MAG: PemK-like protein [Herbinix sp.]|jgi:mRNA-degrading endonuclease toxin of MazEF toxin-antitoxin module|nr:PemK-like protein [Herbinix sp.]
MYVIVVNTGFIELKYLMRGNRHMSKDKSKEEIIKHKKNAIRSLNDLMESFIASPEKYAHKVDLLSYWIETYSNYIKQEETFDHLSLKSYKRGDVIKLNFGFNVGSEYGGLHYAVVIGKVNARNSKVLNVVPLTSLKEVKKVHPNDVFLGDEIYKQLKLKHNTVLKLLKKEIDESNVILEAAFNLNSICMTELEELNSVDTDKMDLPELEIFEKKIVSHEEKALKLRNLIDATLDKQNECREYQKQVEKIKSEILRMKEGSIALVDQITTVSKMRIYDPKYMRDTLAGIKLSPTHLDDINNKMKELFIFEQNSQ